MCSKKMSQELVPVDTAGLLPGAPSDWEDFEPTRPSQHIPGAPLPQISQTTKSPGFIRAFRFLETNKTTASKEDLTYGVREWARERNWRFVRRIQPGRARFQLGELKWVKRPPRQHPRENRTSGDGQDRQQPAVDASPIRHKFGEGKAHPRSHQLELVGPGQGERHAGKAKKEKRKARKEKQMLTADHIQNLPSSPHLQMMLGADPIDPFSNFPIRLNSKSRELCHHYLTIIPSLYFGDQRRDVFNPLRDIVFKMFASHRATLYNLFAYTAANMAMLRGDRGSLDSLHHKTLAIQAVNKRLQDPSQQYTDETVVSVATFVWLEQMFGTPEAFRIHSNAFRHMLRRREGLASFKHNRSMDIGISWLFLLISAKDAADFRLDLTSENHFSRETTIELHEKRKSYIDILTLLSDLQTLNLNIATFSRSRNPRSSEIHRLRTLLFQRGTPVYALLSSDFQVINIPNRRHTKQTVQLFSLLYINLTLFQYRDSPAQAESFLRHLHTNVIENDVVSIELLTWALLRDLDDVPERRWDVVRMQRVLDFLTSGTREMVKMFLLMNLAPQGPRGDAPAAFPIELYMGRIRAEFVECFEL